MFVQSELEAAHTAKTASVGMAHGTINYANYIHHFILPQHTHTKNEKIPPSLLTLSGSYSKAKKLNSKE